MNNQRIVVSLNLKRTIKIMKLTVLMLAVCLSSVVAFPPNAQNCYSKIVFKLRMKL